MVGRAVGFYDNPFHTLEAETMIFKILLLFVVVAMTHTYEARIRLNGKVSTTQVQASDAGQAKKLVQSQFPNATVLSVKKVD